MELIKKIKVYGIKRVIQYIIPETKRMFRKYFCGSYSHLGEDLFLSRCFPKGYKGFFVDVGANDPKRLNNSYYFYKRGWRGINIEPDPKCFEKIEKQRPEDINLNIGISDKGGNLDCYFFFPSLLNTFSKKEADQYISEGYELQEIKKIEVKKLEDVLDKYLPEKVRIDILCIDTEGYDLNVLKGMDIEKFKPKFICVECTHEKEPGGILYMLQACGYSEVFFNGSNSIFKYTVNF